MCGFRHVPNFRPRSVADDLQGPLEQPFDQPKLFPLRRIAEGNGDTGCSGTRRASDAVHIAFRFLRQVVINDVRYVVDIDTA